MTANWVKIKSESNHFRAEIIRTRLEEEGIHCVLVNKKDSSYQHIGEIEIFVDSNEVVLATHLLSKLSSDQ